MIFIWLLFDHSLPDYLLLSFPHIDIFLMGSVVTKSSSSTSCLVILIVIISSSPIKVLPKLFVDLLLCFLLFRAFLIKVESVFEKGKLRLLFLSCFGSILFNQCVFTQISQFDTSCSPLNYIGLRCFFCLILFCAHFIINNLKEDGNLKSMTAQKHSSGPVITPDSCKNLQKSTDEVYVWPKFKFGVKKDRNTIDCQRNRLCPG